MAHDLSISTIASGQASGQHQTSNDADAQIANALADIYGTGIDFTSDVTLTATQFRSAMIFKPDDALPAARNLTLPAVKRPFKFHNPDSTYAVTIIAGTTEIDVGPGEIFDGYTDGTANGLFGSVRAEATAGGLSHPMPVPLSYAGGPPTSSEVMGGVMATEEIDFAANFAGSYGHIGTNPTSSFAIDVQDDGASIGTITISTGGAFTFTTASGTAKTVAAGSRIEFIAPSSADATAAYILATLKGTA